MLARENRLRTGRDIERVFRRGRWGGGELLQLKAWRSGLAMSRAVVIVSKKVSKKAVERNTIRRRVAAQLAQMWGTIPPGYDIVINAKADLSKTPVGELQKHISAALKQASVTESKDV